jgi:hypothetical protein
MSAARHPRELEGETRRPETLPAQVDPGHSRQFQTGVRKAAQTCAAECAADIGDLASRVALVLQAPKSRWPPK